MTEPIAIYQEGNNPILELQHVNLWINTTGVWKHILKDISILLRTGERWGIIGESGAGKSMMMYVILSLLISGQTRITGKVLIYEQDGSTIDLLTLSHEKRRSIIAKKVGIIFQDSTNALNPFERIGEQWMETASFHHGKKSPKELKLHLIDKLEQFGLEKSEAILNKYPSELSGGMRQRIAIALALESDAPILIADEPTTSLDTINQRKIVQLICHLCDEKHINLLYISHNLGLVKEICTHVAVMCNGEIIEQGTNEQVFCHPSKDYTQKMITETKKLSAQYHMKSEKNNGDTNGDIA